MSWLPLALSAPFIWSLLNHTDKYLISKYSNYTGVGGLSILSSIFAALSLPIIFLIERNVFAVSLNDMLILIITGVITSIAIIFYLNALNFDEASQVVPFWFLIPIFSYIFGIFILDEHIVQHKIIGSLITLVGAFILSIDFDHGLKVRGKTLVLMISSSLFLALNNVLFKDAAQHNTFWQSFFWNQAGIFVVGLTMLIFIGKYRRDFISVIKVKSTELQLLNIFGEILQIVAEFVLYYAILMAPVSLVLLIGYTFQPLFVFIEGIIITLLFPNLIKEKISHKYILQKLTAIIIMAIGVYRIMV